MDMTPEEWYKKVIPPTGWRKRWLLFRLRLQIWKMEIFHYFKKPLYLRDNTAKSP